MLDERDSKSTPILSANQESSLKMVIMKVGAFVAANSVNPFLPLEDIKICLGDIWKCCLVRDVEVPAEWSRAVEYKVSRSSVPIEK